MITLVIATSPAMFKNKNKNDRKRSLIAKSYWKNNAYSDRGQFTSHIRYGSVSKQ